MKVQPIMLFLAVLLFGGASLYFASKILLRDVSTHEVKEKARQNWTKQEMGSFGKSLDNALRAPQAKFPRTSKVDDGTNSIHVVREVVP